VLDTVAREKFPAATVKTSGVVSAMPVRPVTFGNVWSKVDFEVDGVKLYRSGVERRVRRRSLSERTAMFSIQVPFSSWKMVFEGRGS
jgi:hypothetical protein